MDFKKGIINKDEEISIVQQCEILGLSRSALYYEPKPMFTENDFRIMNEMQDIAINFPFYGHRMIWKELLGNDYSIGRDRVRKFMQLLGIKPIYPKPKTTIANKEHQVYPYLLKDLEIWKSNQVWASDITYLPTEHGFCYMVAIIDWYSRAILSYRISNTMDKSFCIEALYEAIEKYGKPEIFNSDQGCQYTSKEFIKILEDSSVKISMDGKGRAIDNIIIERFWRTLKYEDIKIKDYRNIKDIKEGVKKYIEFYNNKRRHSSLGYITPLQEYFKGWRRKAA